MSGIEVGGGTRDDVRRRLVAVLDQPLRVRVGGLARRLSRSAAGLGIDVEATTDRAFDAGRSGPLGGAWSSLAGVAAGRDVTLAARIDDTRVRRVIRDLAQRYDRRSSIGALRIDPGTLAVSTTPPRPGRVLLQRAARIRVREALEQRAGQVRLPVRRRPAVATSEVAGVGEAVRSFLASPVRVAVAGRLVTLAPRRIAPALRLELDTSGDGARLGAGGAGLDRLVDDVTAKVSRPAREPAISAPARSVLVEGKGDLAWRPRPADTDVRPGRRGIALRRADARRRIAAAIRSRRHDVALEVERIEPAVSTAAARRARYLIGTFTTRYEPGQPRVTNIRRIAKAVDGTVIAPGRRFSLNGLSGPRTRDKGYVEAPFIADGKIVPSVGGGVSQFSTTVYNAAYFAGLRLDAHRPHSLYIDRYPPGRESTLNFPDIDLAWTNDTDTPVFVRASSAATSVTVTLYGSNGRRRVRAVTGGRRPVAGRDFAITVTRVLRYADGRTVRQPHTTTYDKPVPSD